MSLESTIAGTRAGVGLFEMDHRGLLEVAGEDRVRWLDGMISGDVEALAKAESGAGCRALLLTNRGAIIADLHVARIDDVFLLESLASAIPRIREALERLLIADDVELRDRSRDFAVLGLEGPRATERLRRVTGGDFVGLARESWTRTKIAGCEVLVAAFGFSGESAYQLRMKPKERARVEKALVEAGAEDGSVRGDLEALEVLRVEAGIPLLGAELDEEVLPPEARLEDAISTEKGCYVGQEIVARLRARGQVRHLLVGLRLEASVPPPADTKLRVDGRVTGELTSIVRSPTQGVIALGYVRREHAEPGTCVEFEFEGESGIGRVVALPFVEGTRVEEDRDPGTKSGEPGRSDPPPTATL